MGTAVARISRELSVVGRHSESPVTKIGRETFQALVMQALQLRRIYREVYILCDIKGYSTSETASILGISEETVTRRLRRARGQMRRDNQASSNF